MVNFQRINLLDSTAPNPSVETLLHAFLPHTFIDHTHAAAVLSLVDQPNGEELVEEVYDGSMGFVPYVIPGFGLAKLAAQVLRGQARRRRPDPAQARHLHVRRDRARSLRAHDRARDARRAAPGQGSPQRVRRGQAAEGARAPAAEVAPIIRGACAVRPASAGGEPKRFVLDFRTSPEILNYVGAADLADYQPARRGDARPRHSHQEQAAVGAGAGGRQARRLQGRRAAAPSTAISPTTTPCSHARTPASAAPRPSSTPCRAWCSCRASACSASAPRPRMPPLPPTSPKRPSRSSPTPRLSAASKRCPKATCSTSSTGAWSRPS